VTVDGVLISLVPDGATPIGPESIRPAVPEAAIPALRAHLYLKDTTDINVAAGLTNQVEYDGMTARLRLHAFVTPGVHKVKIAIADRDKMSNAAYRASVDSGLFIRKGSIRTIAPAP
jgi:hypothetical protein